MSFKVKMIGPVLLSLIIIIKMFAITSYFTSKQKDDGLVINLAGRQRMLTQKMTKELMIYLDQKSKKASSTQLKETMKIFDLTLKALTNGGKAPLGLNLKKTKYRNCPPAMEPAHSQLIKVNKIWTQFSSIIDKLILSKDTNGSSRKWILDNNLKLLKEMNAAVVMMQKMSESKIKTLLNFQIIAVLAGFIIIFISFLIFAKVTHQLNNITLALDKGTDQISDEADSIAQSSNFLAHGVSSQATAIEESSDFLTQVSISTKDNAKNSLEATNVMDKVESIVQSTEGLMENLSSSISEINNASAETSRIVKTIDEIAFQTNLLALNAAVEAARAGESGAGFAVVAKEVRALATRSARAAKTTSNLIDETLVSVSKGNDNAASVVNEFKLVREIIEKALNIVKEISISSNKQSNGVEKITKVITSLEDVIQKNSAISEEFASTAEEMSAQSKKFKNIVKGMVSLTGAKNN